MSFAQDMIDALDMGLAQAGETVRLMRMVASPGSGIASQVTCLAVIRGYAPSDLVPGSGINQQDQKFIFSPTPIVAANWPGNGNFIPRQGDRIATNRGVLTVQAGAGIYVQDTLVRIELQARGT